MRETRSSAIRVRTKGPLLLVSQTHEIKGHSRLQGMSRNLGLQDEQIPGRPVNLNHFFLFANALNTYKKIHFSRVKGWYICLTKLAVCFYTVCFRGCQSRCYAWVCHGPLKGSGRKKYPIFNDRSCIKIQIWMFPKIGFSPKWMVHNGKPY